MERGSPRFWGDMAGGTSHAPPPHAAVVIDRRSLLVGGVVALLGLALLAGFLWMVPHAAHREVAAACKAMRSITPDANARCVRGDEACERSISLAQLLCKPGQRCAFPLPAPDFTAIDNRGRPVHLADLRGKVVLLNFWGSWCGLCKFEKPHLAAIAKDLAGDDLQVVALASDRTWSDALLAVVEALTPNVPRPRGDNVPLDQALATYQRALPDGVPFQVYLDPPADDGNIGASAQQWGLTKVPDTVLIDREGQIRAYFVSKRDWGSTVAETCVRSLIDEN
jgi:thiol-disulfide isomerase/thioredoxin